MLTLDQAIGVAFITPAELPFGAPYESPLTIFGIPIILWGSPGIGKSKRIKHMMDRAGVRTIILNAAGYQPEDFCGIPVRIHDEFKRVCALNQVTEASNCPASCIFFDDIGLAARAVQKALLPVFLERRFGDVVIPNTVRLVGAANEVDDTDGEGNPLLLPLANRSLHRFEPPMTVEQFVEYRLSGPSKDVFDIKDAQDEMRRRWDKELRRTNADITTFLSRKGDSALQNIPPMGHKDRGHSWPSARTWEYATHLLTASRCLDMPIEEGQELMSYAVGNAASEEWLTFQVALDLPDIKDVLQGKWAPDAQRLDVTIAVLHALRTAKHDDATVTAIWRVLENCVDACLTDLVRPHAQALVNNGFGLKNGKAWTIHAKKVLGALYGEKHL